MQTRYSGQHGRKAFGPRRVSKQRQAQYIYESMVQHAARGWHRQVADYTGDEETQQLVAALLQQAA
jgi:hypothetical protein